MIVLEDGRGGARIVTPKLRYRLAAFAFTGALDGALAAGRSPDASTRLALRAHHLTQMSTRRALSRSARRLLATAERPIPAIGLPRLGIGPSVRAASKELSMLASRLIIPGLVAPRGVAKASALLSQAWGSGPRYRNPEQLKAELRETIRSLDALAQR